MDETEPVTPDAPPLRGPVIMAQDWVDLAYLHWAVPPERVSGLMPAGVRPDVLDGVTYVGLVPFRMVGAAPGRLPGVPWLGTFWETNVRLYSVDERGKRGVVFLSLDTDRLGVVLGARAAFNVPYRWARMRHEVLEGQGPGPQGDMHTWRARLRWRGRASSRLSLRVGAPREPDERDHFVSARWGLHTRIPGRTIYVPNEHGRWPLWDAEVVALDDGLLASVGLPELADRAPDHIAFSTGVHTEFGVPYAADSPRR